MGQPYIYQNGEEGISFSFPVFNIDRDVIAVFATDITLETLEKLAENLKNSADDLIILLNSNNEVVLYPNRNNIIRTADNKLRFAKLDEIKRPLVVELVDKRLLADVKNELIVMDYEFDDKHYIVSSKKIDLGFSSDTLWSVISIISESKEVSKIKRANKWIFYIIVGILGLSIFLAFILRSFFKTLKLKSRFIQQIFGRYLSDDFVSKILAAPENSELGGKEEELTILFSDLRSFTAISETISAKEVVDMLNNYLKEMTDIITSYGGIIDNFQGDGILAFFRQSDSLPNHALIATKCAIDMQLSMDKINVYNREHNYPNLKMGIGLHTGSPTVGNIGSVKKLKFGIIGRDVNLASRIESNTLGGQVLISEYTYKECEEFITYDTFVEVQFKGVNKPVTVYNVLGTKGEHELLLPKFSVGELVELISPIKINLNFHVGKQYIDDNVIEGQIVKANLDNAVIVINEDCLTPTGKVKISLFGNDNKLVADQVYAEVVQKISSSEFIIHYTFLSKSGRTLIKQYSTVGNTNT